MNNCYQRLLLIYRLILVDIVIFKHFRRKRLFITNGNSRIMQSVLSYELLMRRIKKYLITT